MYVCMYVCVCMYECLVVSFIGIWKFLYYACVCESVCVFLYISICVLIYKALCFDMAQGRMNGAPNETQTHSCRFASLAS